MLLGDRPAAIYTLHAARGATLIYNGLQDTTVAIPTHGPDFFADLHRRTAELRGAKPESISGRVLTDDSFQAHNTFDKPETVKPAAFSECRLTAGGFTANLPPKSVVVLILK